MLLKIIKGDITKIECDAIVDSASYDLVPRGAVDTAIHKAAGEELANACKKVQPCEVGDCVYTEAYKLPCKYVIHTVVPYSANVSAALFLACCYQRAIKLAQSLKCVSVAFPLLGAGNMRFSVDKALSIAIKQFDTCIRNDQHDTDLLIYLVVYDDETFALAKRKAANMIRKGHYLTDDAPIDGDSHSNIDSQPEPDVYTSESHCISLCRINRPDKNNQTWMLRVADIKDGVLVDPVFDSAKDSIFDNRRLIYRNDGPSEPDSIGFWEWSVEQINIGHWRTKAAYIEQLSPTDVIIRDDLTSAREIVDALKAGIHIPAYARGNVIFAVKKGADFEGVLCNLSSFNSLPDNDAYILKEDVWTLPCYELSDDDILVCKDRRIYRHVDIDEPSRLIPVYMPAETVKQLFLQRMTWPVFKAQGISKSTWQKFLQFLNSVPDDSIPEKLSAMYGVSLQDAQNLVSAFLQNLESYVQVEDVDSGLIVQMLNAHEGLKQSCDALAYQKWQEEHKREIERAQEEAEAVRSQAKRDIDAAKQQLLDLQNAIDSAENRRESVRLEAESAQSRLDRLKADIEQYEAIGKDALSAARQRIADAQHDIAGFIADLSIYLPQSTSPAIEKKTAPWQYSAAPSGMYPEDDIDVAESWTDEINILTQNYSRVLGISVEFSAMLAAFVYAAHINNAPLLIAGPSGCDIAEVLSVSLYGSSAGQLTLGNEYGCDIAEGLKDYREHIVSVQNMFGKGWSDVLPQVLDKLRKQIIWTHPYVEDMLIEPRGLYNYMLPVFSECFVGMSSVSELWPGKRAETFVPFASHRKSRLRTSAFGQLKLSRLLMNQLEKVLSDAKEILDNPNAEKGMEILFGLLPLSVLTGRTDVLKDAIETEAGISSAIKEEAARYIEEV